jgi:cytochrome c-type biogenesis protein
MIATSVSLALAAGMLAALNPCGFALLPAYLALLVSDESASRSIALGRAGKTAAAMTAGFVAVFGLFGLVILPVAAQVQRYLPWVTVVSGAVLLVAGGWLLAGHELPSIGLRGSRAAVSGSMPSMLLFGISYALASLSCTIAPFLAAVFVAVRAHSLVLGIAVFGAYALGMGLVVATAAVAVALASASLVRGMRGVGRHVPRIGGLMLLICGGYVLYYGWWEIRVLAGASTTDPVISAAGIVQHWLTVQVDRLGLTGVLGILAALLLIATLARRTGRRTPR